MIIDKLTDRMANKRDSQPGITLNHLQEFLSHRDNITSDIANRAQEVSNLQKQLSSILENIDILKKKELDRINKEFISNDYSRRFNNVNLKTIIYALVGKEFEVNKQIKIYKVTYQ
jgi:hypothetical protein